MTTSLWAPRRMVLRGLLCLYLGGAFATGPARAGDPLSDPDAFTALVAARARAAVPGTPVTVIGTLAVQIGSGGNADLLDLHTLFSTCQRNPDSIDTVIDTYVTQMSAVSGKALPAKTRDSLRVVVRPAAYLDEIARNLGGRGVPVAQPLPGGLWLLGASDLPTAIEMIDSRDLAPLGLSPADALALGKHNMYPSLRQELEQAQASRTPGVNLITGDPYEASLFAFPELWRPIASAGVGDLLVAVPASDVVLFSDTEAPDALATLHHEAQTVVAQAERPFSATIFRWDHGQWVVAAYGDTPR